MRVLLAAVGKDTCTIGFATSMLGLQGALACAPNVSAMLEFVPSFSSALERAKNDPTIDALAVLRTEVSFPPTFVLRAIAVAPADFVVGVYPLPRVDWDRVVAQAGKGSAEDPRFWGNVYNIDPAAAKPAMHGYLSVAEAELGATVLKRAAIDALDPGATTSDAATCRAWGKEILADLDHPCAVSGPMDFVGCVGHRLMPRG